MSRTEDRWNEEVTRQPIKDSDVIVAITAQFESDYTILRITNRSTDEVKEILDEMTETIDTEWDGNVEAYLEKRDVEFTGVMSSGGENEDYPRFYDLDYDADLNQVFAVTEGELRTQMEYYINRVNFAGRLLTIEEKNLIIKGANQFDNMESAAPYIHEVVSHLMAHGKQEVNTERDEDVNIQKEAWKQAEELAEKLMQFAEDYDYFNYSDYLDNREQERQNLTGDIFMGKEFGVQDFLYSVIDESTEPESAGRAICLCQDLEDYGEQWKNNLCRQDKQLYSKADGNRSIKDRLSENRNRIDRSLKSRDQNVPKTEHVI